MHSRLLSLIQRGYSTEDVVSLSSFTEEELNAAVDMAFQHITRNCFPTDDKSVIYVGGQPGCGKTVFSMNLKNKVGNIVEIGIDNYRMYHPRYLAMEKCIKSHWKNRVENINDTPGNDIADFTHVFAGAMTDKLIEKCSSMGYNIVIEWGMREPSGPLKTMEDLKSKGYNNFVVFICTNKDISYHACELRAEVMKDSLRIIRKVPKNFHDHCVDTLPQSIDFIHKHGFENNLIDYMMLTTRGGNVLWDNKSKDKPGIIYSEYLNEEKYLERHKNDPSVSYNNNRIELGNLFQQDSNISSIIITNLNNVTTKSR